MKREKERESRREEAEEREGERDEERERHVWQEHCEYSCSAAARARWHFNGLFYLEACEVPRVFSLAFLDENLNPNCGIVVKRWVWDSLYTEK